MIFQRDWNHQPENTPKKNTNENWYPKKKQTKYSKTIRENWYPKKTQQKHPLDIWRVPYEQCTIHVMGTSLIKMTGPWHSPRPSVCIPIPSFPTRCFTSLYISGLLNIMEDWNRYLMMYFCETYLLLIVIYSLCTTQLVTGDGSFNPWNIGEIIGDQHSLPRARRHVNDAGSAAIGSGIWLHGLWEILYRKKKYEWEFSSGKKSLVQYIMVYHSTS